jgi:hypothetical protein
MADNFGGGENIYYIDDGNIVLIDPNSEIDKDGRRKDRVVKQENLVMYANLEAQSVPRTKLSVGESVDSGINNVSIASINFLKPQGKTTFDTSYTDQLTAGRNLQGTVNQLSYDKNNNPQQENFVDTQLLGIKSIRVEVLSNGIPKVSMTLTDIQGKALFETGGNSPYSVFLYYPYPLFRLTLKGYYGKAVQYELMLRSFNAKFEGSTGNYTINLEFIARTSAIMDDIRLGYLFSLPNMYPIYTVPTTTNDNTSESATSSLQQVNVDVTRQANINKTSKGYSKLKQVFEEYRKLGLIDKSVPTLTLDEMRINLESYTKFLNEQYEKLDFSSVVALDRYQESLSTYSNDVENWKKKLIDDKSQILLRNGLTMYGLKNVKPTTGNGSNLSAITQTAYSELEKIIEINKKQIESVPNWGKQIPTPQDFFKVSQFEKKFVENDIDFVGTYYIQTGLKVVNTNNVEFQNFRTKLIFDLQQIGVLIGPSTQSVSSSALTVYYLFKTFSDNISNLTVTVEQKKLEESEALNKKLQDNLKVIGTSNSLAFRPTIRNVIGVIVASVDAFYRLMDDVHQQAWNQRDNKARINSIIKTNAPSQEGKNSVQTRNTNQTNIVYPWPQFVEPKENKGITEYQLTYPGKKSVVGFTKGYDTTVWPEVDFVEQFLYGLTIKQLDYNSPTQVNTNKTINYTPSSAIEFEYKDNIYTDTIIYNFFYELYERILLNSFYTGIHFRDTNSDLIFPSSDMEINNVVNSKLPDSILKDILKLELGTKTLYDYLKSTSGPNQEGELWNKFIQQNFNTQYIKERVDKSTELYSNDTYSTLSKTPIKLNSLDNITKYLNDNSTRQFTFFDTYPFRINDFVEKNMEPIGQGGSVSLNDTVNTYTLDSGNLFITNTKNPISPLTKNQSNNKGFTTEESIQNINSFYVERYGKGGSRLLTEGSIEYPTSTSSSLRETQTTSILNTPYFLNALIQASEKSGNEKFTTLSYLFLNSLPIASLYEKYIDTQQNKKDEYIFASLNKFSAVHKLPLAWILKIGSVWYRYKKHVNEGVDILDSVWKDFDYKKAYDPQNGDVKKQYKVAVNSGAISNFQLDGTNTWNTGFYPKLLQSVFSLLTNNQLPIENQKQEFYDLHLKIQSTKEINMKAMSGKIDPYICRFNIFGEWTRNFGNEFENKTLLFPSAGYLPFQQAYYQVSNNLNSDISKNSVNVPQMFNGSARAFWGSPNYGWFDTTNIKKPEPNEYLKYIDKTNNEQFDFILSNNEYSTIEDLFGVFTKEQLDFFESEFLEFSKDGGVPQTLLNSNETETSFANFKEILKKLLIITTPKAETTPKDISQSQMDSISSNIQKFIDISVYLKLGNPNKFNRTTFGYFINGDSKMKPSPNLVINPYVQGTLPDGTITLDQFKTSNEVGWKSLQLNIGFSTIPKIAYSNSSYIFDFFIDNDIEFTTTNVELFAPLIKIYATQKELKKGNYYGEDFQKDITDIINSIYTKRTQIEDQVRAKLPGAINKGPTTQDVVKTNVDADSTKLEMWETFKALNDKWVSGIDFNRRTLFEEFLFFDKANRDIGDDFIVKVESIRKYCSWKNSNTSVMSLIRNILSENRMNFFVLPAYVNFYGKPSRRVTNRNQTILNNANDVFSSFGYVDYIDSAPKFLCQYIGKPSETLSMDNDSKYPFKSDSFDLGVSAGNPIRNTNSAINQYNTNKAVGFVVDFGVQNQSVFKSIEIAQNQNVTTSEQIQVVTDMGLAGGNKKTSQQTVSLFEFYKTRNYDCTIKILGNVMIQPTMYFVLRHMPMFNGTYIIRNVVHEIQSGSFSTTFVGQRLSSLSTPQIFDELAAINEDFTKKLDGTVRQAVSNNNVVTFNSQSRVYLTGQEGNDYKIKQRVPYQGFIYRQSNADEQTCETNLWGYPESDQSKIKRVDFKSKIYRIDDLVSEFKKISDNDVRLFLFCLFFLDGYNPSLPTFNIYLNNLFGATADVEWNKELIKFANGYRCLQDKENKNQTPFLYFDDTNKCFDFTQSYFKDYVKTYLKDENNFPCITAFTSTDISTVVNQNCLAQVYVKLFYDKWYTSDSTTPVTATSNKQLYDNWLRTAQSALELARIKNLLG